MDLTKLSDEDLQSLSIGDMTKLSDEGLNILAGIPQKRNTTFGEDLSIGLNNAAAPVVKFGGLVAGAGAGLVGADGVQESIYKGMDEQLKSMENYWVPKDAEQNFTGKAIGTVGTLPMQLLSFPFSPADTGKEMVDAGETTSKAMDAAAIDTLMNTAGVALPGAIGGSLLKKFVTGAGINAAQETYTKKVINTIAETEKAKEKFKPTLEGAALSAIVGGPLGMATPSRTSAAPTAVPVKDPINKVDPSMQSSNQTPSDGEITMLTRVYKSSISKIENIEKVMTDVNDAIAQSVESGGDVPSHLMDTLKELEDQHKRLSSKVNEMENILSDPTQIPESYYTANKVIQDDLRNQIKTRRKKNRQPGIESDPTEADIAKRFGDEEPVGNRSELRTIEEPSVESRPPKEPLMSPIEVAAIRIGEASSMPKEKLVARLQKAMEALDTLPERVEKNDTPGSKYSSIKNALEQEVKAYQSLLRGEKPDLSWFEGKPDPVPEPPVDPRQPPPEAYTFDERGEPSNYRSPIDGRTRSPAQAYQHHTYNYNKLSRILENVNKQIAAHEAGQLPSGTFDIAQKTAMRDSLESQVQMHKQALENVLQNSPSVKDNLNNTVGDPVVEVPKKSYIDVRDIVAKEPENMVNAFLDNMQMFSSKKGSDIHFDANVPKELQRVMRSMLETLGLGKEKVFIIDSDVNTTGRAEHFGNTTVLHLNRDALTKRFGSSAFGTLRVAAHEMGHFLFNKYLQETIIHTSELHKLDEQFRTYIANNRIDPSFINDSASLLKTQQWFHEFFAERTARALMYDHVLGKFAQSSKYLVALSKMLTDSYRQLKSKFNLTKRNFVDDIISDIISGNKESIEQTGKTVFEKIQVERNDKAILDNTDPDIFPFAKATLENVMEKAQELGWLIPNKERKAIAENNFDPKQVPLLSKRALASLGSGANTLARKMFGKTGLQQIFKDNPIIKNVYWKIRDAEMRASKISNNIWFGDVGFQVWNSKNFFAKLSKVKEKASAYMVVKTSKPEDMALVHDILKKGFEDGLEYHETLDKYGSQLNVEQQGIFKSLTTMFQKQYDEITKVQDELGKKNILPRRKGWYPAVRKGDYYVDINYQGTSAYRQHFTTKAEGEAFLQKLGQGTLKHLSATGVEKIKLEDSNPFLDSIETFKDFLEKKYPNAGGVLKKDIEGLVEALITKGGKLGKHHTFRSNLEGYKGSEVFSSDKERGNSFKEAIQNSVGDYTGSLRKMMINHSIEPLIRNRGDQWHPETLAAVQQMTDSALNRVENKMQVVDDGVRNWVDARAKDLYDLIGKDFKYGDPAFDKIKNALLETFYLTKLMAKPVFAIGQVLSTPVQAIRHMAYDGGFRAYMSFGKGMLSLASGNQALKDSMYRVSQTTNTFEPQFIEALHLNKNDSSLLEGIKKWVFLNKVNEGADSFSRVLTYASMYEHYKSLGKSPEEAERLAMHGTDTTMVQYGSSEQAPMFKHTGILGEMARPLQTFGQAQLANIIGDIRHFQTKNPKTWAPLLTYGLTTMMVGGALSATFITEYEILRKWLSNMYPDYALPSVLDLVARDDSMMDRILPDEELTRKAMLYGLPSMTGLDLSASVRANQTFGTLVASVLMAEESWTQMLPLISVTADVVQGSGTLLSHALGKDHTSGQMSKAISQVSPVGPIAYGAKELAGVNTTKIGGENTNMMQLGNTGDASKERTSTDVVAGLLGTKSTDDRYTTQLALQRTEIDKRRQTQIKKLADLAIETGDPKYMEKIVSFNLEPNALKTMIGSEMYSRLVDIETRYIVNSKGKAPANAETARKANQIFNFRSKE